jgi:hypothetical protein
LIYISNIPSLFSSIFCSPTAGGSAAGRHPVVYFHFTRDCKNANQPFSAGALASPLQPRVGLG